MDLVDQQEHKFQDFLLQTMGDDLILLGAWEPVMTAVCLWWLTRLLTRW